MTDYFIEAILLWAEKGPSSEVKNWLVQRDLTVTVMQKGLLISGGQSVFEKVFQMDSLQAERPLAVPVPDQISDKVSSITIPRKKRF